MSEIFLYSDKTLKTFYIICLFNLFTTSVLCDGYSRKVILFYFPTNLVGAVIVWWLDLQLSVQSVPIATKIEFEPRSCRGVLDTTLCDKVCQRLATGR